MIPLFLLLASCIAMVNGKTQCSAQNTENLVQKFITSTITTNCPGIFDDPQKEYCCLDKDGLFYCCFIYEYYFEHYFILLIIAAVVAIAVSCVCSLICCLCCPFCYCYKRR